MDNRPTLYEIGNKYQTDKSWYHLYTVLYDTFFSSIRYKHIRMLEIGILVGSSMMMWDEYFEHLEYYGVDLCDASRFDSSRIKTIIANQENEQDLKSLPKDLDIIIDDGGHTMLQQQMTLKTLFVDHLKPDGTYILEDLHTSEPEYYNTHGSNDMNNTLKLLYDLQNGKPSENNQYFLSENEFYKVCSAIKSIDIYKVKHDSITSRITRR